MRIKCIRAILFKIWLWLSKSLIRSDSTVEVSNKIKVNETTPKIIRKVVLLVLDISLESMQKDTRKREIVVSRQILAYLLHTYTSMTLSDVGKFIRPDKPLNYSTIVHAKKAVLEYIFTDYRGLRKKIHDIEKILNLK